VGNSGKKESSAFYNLVSVGKPPVGEEERDKEAGRVLIYELGGAASQDWSSEDHQGGNKNDFQTGYWGEAIVMGSKRACFWEKGLFQR